MSHVPIIEDEMLIAMHLENLVAELGFKSVDLLATESDAIALARVRPPSIILSDIRLDQGSGPAAVRAIRAALGPIPVVFISGNPENSPTDLEASFVLPMPVPDHQLAAILRMAIRSRAEEPPMPPVA